MFSLRAVYRGVVERRESLGLGMGMGVGRSTRDGIRGGASRKVWVVDGDGDGDDDREGDRGFDELVLLQVQSRDTSDTVRDGESGRESRFSECL